MPAETRVSALGPPAGLHSRPFFLPGDTEWKQREGSVTFLVCKQQKPIQAGITEKKYVEVIT